MSPSTNTRSGFTDSKETISTVPTNYTTSTCLSTSDLENIHNDIKSITDKHHSDMKALNDHISDIIAKITDKISEKDNQE